MLFEEDNAVEDDRLGVALWRVVASAGYFETMRIPLLVGRRFDPRPGDSLSVLLSAAAAQDLWPGEDPLGRLIYPATTTPPPSRLYTVVGIVADLPSQELTGEERNLSRVIYHPSGLSLVTAARITTVVIRTSTSPLGLVEAVRNTLWSMDAGLPFPHVQTMEEYARSARAPMAFTMVLLVVGGVAALLLGLIGIYGVITYVVGRRTNEIGVRMALGARSEDVSMMVLRQGGSVVALGIVGGLAGSFALTRLMESVVFGVSPTDPATYIAASIGLLMVALAATYLPARRAARVAPVEALRAD